MSQEHSSERAIEGDGDAPNQSRKLPVSDQESDAREEALVEFSATWQGPLPPPTQLAAYNDAVPDGAERILAMTERGHAQLLQVQTRVVRDAYRLALVGQLMGVLLAIGLLLLAGYVAYLGAPVVTVAIVAMNIASVAGVFFFGYNRRRRRPAPEDPVKIEDD